MSKARRLLSTPAIRDVYVVHAPRVAAEMAGQQGGPRLAAAQGLAVPTPEQKIEALRKESYQQGYEKGRTDGAAACDEQLSGLIRSLADGVVELRRRREELASDLEEAAVRLALAVAEKVILKECSTSSEVVRRVVHEALRRIAPRDVVAIRVNPADKEEVEQRCVAALPDDGHHIEVVGDPAVSRGGCVVETQLGMIDAAIESQLRGIAEELLEEHDERRHA